MIRFKIIRAILILSAFFIVSCTSEINKIGKITLEQDTVWSGSLLISGDVYVPPGVTLTIRPGTVVKFERIDETSGQNCIR